MNESRVTHQYSLYEWALILGGADQSRWLRKYSTHEIGQLLSRHKGFTHGFVTLRGEPAGFAIAFPTDGGETVHIAFIVSFVPQMMNTFLTVLNCMYPQATHVSFLRRNELRKFPVNNLARMLALCPTQPQPKLQNA